MSKEQKALKNHMIVKLMENEHFKNLVSTLNNPTVDNIYDLLKTHYQNYSFSEKKTKKVIENFLKMENNTLSNPNEPITNDVSLEHIDENKIENEENPNTDNYNNKDTQSDIKTLNNDSEEITSEKKVVKNSTIFIDNVKSKEYENLSSISNNFDEQMKNINIKLDNINDKLIDIMSNKNDMPNKTINHPNVQMINEIINSNDKVTVQVNKELLSKAARYIDNNSLVKFEDIIKRNCDIDTFIIQYILVLFIQQNSL